MKNEKLVGMPYSRPELQAARLHFRTWHLCFGYIIYCIWIYIQTLEDDSKTWKINDHLQFCNLFLL